MGSCTVLLLHAEQVAQTGRSNITRVFKKTHQQLFAARGGACYRLLNGRRTGRSRSPCVGRRSRRAGRAAMLMSSSVGSHCGGAHEAAVGYGGHLIPSPKRAASGVKPFGLCGPTEAANGAARHVGLVHGRVVTLWDSARPLRAAAGACCRLLNGRRTANSRLPRTGRRRRRAEQAVMLMSSSVGSHRGGAHEAAVGYGECPLPAPERALNGAKPFAVCGPSEATSGGCGNGDVVRGGESILRSPRGRCRLQRVPATGPKRALNGARPFAVCGPLWVTSGRCGNGEVVRGGESTLRSPAAGWGLLGGSIPRSYTGIEQAEAVRPVREVSDDEEGTMRCWARTRTHIRPMGARFRMRRAGWRPCRDPEGRRLKCGRSGCTIATAWSPPSPVRRPPRIVDPLRRLSVGAGDPSWCIGGPGEVDGSV
jgi:hypothetical protein